MAKKKKKSNGVLGTVILILIVVLFIGGIIAYTVLNRDKPIPDDAIGNTSGNLNNRGLFCEKDGYVYFSNSYDLKKLYRMKSDGTEVECISDVPAEFINVYGDKVFFYQTPSAEGQVFGLGGLYGVCYTSTDGKIGMNSIDKALVNSLVLYGPNLYYQRYTQDDGLELYVADALKKTKVKLSDKRVFVSTPYNGKFMTYNEDIGYFLSLYNPANDSFELYDQEAKVYNVVIDNGFIYYMNIDDSYRIWRMSLSGFNKERLTDYRVDLFNVYEGNIFFQKNSETDPALMYMKADGSGEKVIAQGNFTNINCTSTYTYFHGFGARAPMYRIPTNGSGSYEEFIPQ